MDNYQKLCPTWRPWHPPPALSCCLWRPCRCLNNRHSPTVDCLRGYRDRIHPSYVFFVLRHPGFGSVQWCEVVELRHKVSLYRQTPHTNPFVDVDTIGNIFWPGRGTFSGSERSLPRDRRLKYKAFDEHVRPILMKIMRRCPQWVRPFFSFSSNMSGRWMPTPFLITDLLRGA